MSSKFAILRTSDFADTVKKSINLVAPSISLPVLPGEANICYVRYQKFGCFVSQITSRKQRKQKKHAKNKKANENPYKMYISYFLFDKLCHREFLPQNGFP